jgi:hypothetical protein
VTVLIIVLAVHPWLMSLRGDILKAKTIILGYPSSMPTEFMVKSGPEFMMIEEKEHWIQGMRGGPRPSTIPASILNRLRRNR